MEIKRTQKEEQTSLISVKVGEKDYGEAVEKSLRDYRRKANIPVSYLPSVRPKTTSQYWKTRIQSPN